jgi:hypothetical protein
MLKYFRLIFVIFISFLISSCGSKQSVVEDFDDKTKAEHFTIKSVTFLDALSILNITPPSSVLDITCFKEVTSSYPDLDSEYFSAYFCQENPVNQNSFFTISVGDDFIFLTESKVLSSISELEYYYNSLSLLMSQSCAQDPELDYDNLYNCPLGDGSVVHVILEGKANNETGFYAMYITYTYSLESYISLLQIMQ